MSSDIIWRDGFDFLGANDDTDLPSRCDRALGTGGDAVASSQRMVVSGDGLGRFGGRYIRRSVSTPSGNSSWCYYVLESGLSQICLSAAVYRRVTPTSGGNTMFWLRSSTGTTQLKIRIGVGGVLEVATNAGTAIAATTAVLPLENWIWISVRIIRHATTGSVRLVLQGLEDTTVSNIDTDPSSSEYARFGYGNPNTTGEFGTGTVTTGIYWLDDVHVSNDILSERRIVTLYPESDVLAEWTPNAVVLGNYDRVNQEISDGDTTYVAADDQGTKDIYGFGALPAGVGDIDGVTVNIVARKEDAGDTRKVTGVIRVADVDHYFADEHTLLTGYSWFSSVMPDPPSGAWTEAKLEKFGMDLTVGETSP